MSTKRINELTIAKTIPSPLDYMAMDTPTIGAGETYKIKLSDLAAAISSGALTGDMLQSTYDPDGDGTVTAAHQLQLGNEVFMKMSVTDIVMTSQQGDIVINSWNKSIFFEANGANGKVYYNGKEILTTDHTDADNPHAINKDKVGLGNVDNTADLDKPISGAVTLELLSYIQRSGLQTVMAAGYSPLYSGSVATRGYVDSKISIGTVVYVADTVVDMYLIENISVGDRCIVTADPTSSNDGEYVCILANLTAPSTSDNWQKQTIGAGNLLKDGSIPMDAGYIASPSSRDIAPMDQVQALIDGAFGYTDAEIAALNVDVVANNAAITALETSYQHYTWAIPSISGTELSKILTPMVVMPPAGETWYLSRVALVASDDFNVDMQEDGSDLVGWTQLDGTAILGIIDLADTELTSPSLLAPKVVHQVPSGLTDVTVTIEIKKVRS